MNTGRHLHAIARSLLPALLLAACNLRGQPASPPISPPAATSPAVTSPAAVEHRIGIRLVDGAGEFYDRVTGAKFTPRGMNYIHLAEQPTDDGGRTVYHSLFDPGRYEPALVGEALEKMKEAGYNTVRVFMSQNTIDAPDGGLSDEYLANMADFITQAQANGLFVMPTIDWSPGGRYGQLLLTTCCEQFNMNNAQYLPSGGVRANAAFFQDLVRGLVDQGAPLEAVLSFELRNEMYFDTDFAPFTLTSGSVTTANGKSYDMGSASDRELMVDESTVTFINTVRTAILEADPTALVSVGFFVPSGPNPARIGDARLVSTYPAIWQSEADFIDLHPYPGGELTLQKYVENFEMEGMQEKPILMGEFGVNRGDVPSLSRAAQMAVDWQVESCAYGFDGWLFWTWDTDEQPEFYNAVQDEALIGRNLSPALRPDPCSREGATESEVNLALGKSVTATHSNQSPAENAVDGTGAAWGAGAPPPQWITIDLGATYAVSAIRLSVGQYPNGGTTHEVWVGDRWDGLQKVHVFDGVTSDGELLVFAPDAPLEDVRFVRIVTTHSPSWVAWKEIEVIQAAQ